MGYSSQGDHIGRIDVFNWLAGGSTMGKCDYHYAPPSLSMMTFLINSQWSSYPFVLTRLGRPHSRPNTLLNLWKCRELHAFKNPRVIKGIWFTEANIFQCRILFTFKEESGSKACIHCTLISIKHIVVKSIQPHKNTQRQIVYFIKYFGRPFRAL